MFMDNCGKCIYLLLAVCQLVGGFFGIICGVLLLTRQWIPGLESASNYIVGSKYMAIILLVVRDYKLYANLIGLVEIVFGVLCIVTAILSIVGMVKDSKRLLMASAILKTVMAILIWISALALVIGQSAITSGVHRTLKRELQNSYRGTSGRSAIYVTFAMIQTEFQCCGVDGYTDYQRLQSKGRKALIQKRLVKQGERTVQGLVPVMNAKEPAKFVKTSYTVGPAKDVKKYAGPANGVKTSYSGGPTKRVKTYAEGPANANGVKKFSTVEHKTNSKGLAKHATGHALGKLVAQIPVTCCKGTGNYKSFLPFNKKCIIKPTDANSYWKTGCLGKIRSFLVPYWTFMVVSFIGLLLISVICVWCSWVSVARAGRSEYEIK